jgi:hypothetical protein
MKYLLIILEQKNTLEKKLLYWKNDLIYEQMRMLAKGVWFESLQNPCN